MSSPSHFTKIQRLARRYYEAKRDFPNFDTMTMRKKRRAWFALWRYTMERLKSSSTDKVAVDVAQVQVSRTVQTYLRDAVPRARFDDVWVELSPHDSTILIRVRKRGKELKVHENAAEFPSPTLRAKVLLFAQE